MDGYFDLEHQDIAIRKGMSEVQTVSAVIHEMAHALLHNRTKDTEEKTPELSRSTEEVQAESISYAVCAYLERDEVQLLSLTESTLTKLATMTDEEFGQLELYPDFDI